MSEATLKKSWSLPVAQKSGEMKLFALDEQPRPDTTIEMLGKLKPIDGFLHLRDNCSFVGLRSATDINAGRNNRQLGLRIL